MWMNFKRDPVVMSRYPMRVPDLPDLFEETSFLYPAPCQNEDNPAERK